MKPEEMKAIAEKRDKSFLNDSKKLWSPVEIGFCKTDADFIAMVSKNWDKLMAVVEAAKFMIDEPANYVIDTLIYGDKEPRTFTGLAKVWDALEELEKE